jgi:hypothetical protein
LTPYAAARVKAGADRQAEADDYYARTQAEAQREAEPEVDAGRWQSSVPSVEMAPEALQDAAEKTRPPTEHGT